MRSRLYRVEIGRGTNNRHVEFGDTEAEAWDKMVTHAQTYHQGLADGFLVNATTAYAVEGSQRWREYSQEQQEQVHYAGGQRQ